MMPARKTAASAAVTLGLTALLASSWTIGRSAWAQEEEGSTAAVETGTDASLAARRRLRDALIDARDFDGALTPAQNIVAAQQAAPSSSYPADLAALGLIQGELRQTEQAEVNLLAAIELVVAAEGEISPTLIEYYRGLGRTYIRGARYPEAIGTLEQAKHISQRQLGLFNVEQAPLIDDITTAYLGLGDTLEAQKMQLERLENAVRRFGADDPRVVPFRYTLANYFERSRLPESAREQYEEVMTAQETRFGNTDAALLGPLRQLVKIDLLVTQDADPERRDRLAEVLEQNPGASVLDRGLTLATLGDWATVAGDSAAAHDYYRQAWNAFSSDPELDTAAYFSKPTMLDFIAPLSAVDRGERSRPYAWADVVLEFDVSAEGLPSDVRVITRGEPAAQIMSRYSRRLRETHFRPRIVDGKPVATSNVRSTHLFRYYVQKERD